MPKVSLVSSHPARHLLALTLFLAILGVGAAIKAQMLTPLGDAPVHVSGGLFGRTLTQTLRFEQPGSGLAVLRLDNVNGNVTVVGAADPVIKIAAIKELRTRGLASEAGARSLLESVKVEVTPEKDALRIHTVFPSLSVSSNLKVDYEIQLPPSMRVETKTVNGNVKVEKVDGPVQVEAKNGNQTYRKLGGPLTVKSSNGNISAREVAGPAAIAHHNGNLDFHQIGAALKVNSDNGNIDLRDVAGDATLSWKNGNAKCRDVAGALALDSHTGNLDITQSRVFEKMGLLKADSHTGSVRLTLDKAQPFILEASCNTGSIASAFPVKIEGKGPAKRAAGLVGQGGPSIRLNVGTGRIDIRQN